MGQLLIHLLPALDPAFPRPRVGHGDLGEACETQAVGRILLRVQKDCVTREVGAVFGKLVLKDYSALLPVRTKALRKTNLPVRGTLKKILPADASACLLVYFMRWDLAL